MVKVMSTKLEKTPTWGLFNHTIIINNKENTKKSRLFNGLDFFVFFCCTFTKQSKSK